MTTISTIKFLGCSVVSFSSTMGFNSNPSTMSITLAEDFEKLDNFLADDHSIGDELSATSGGTPLTSGNPGTLATFSTPDTILNFTGFVTGYRRTKSTSGNLIYLEMSDPRFLLSQIPIINDVNLNINTTSFNATTWNIFCSPAIFTNPVILDWHSQGVGFAKLMNAFSYKTFGFYGKDFKIALHSSFSQNLIGGYRLKQQVGSVEEAINQAAKDAGMDWYIKINPTVNPGYNTIQIFGIKRKNQYVFNSDNGLKTFISDRADRVSSWEVGRELRQEPSVAIVVGDRVRTLWNTSPGGNFNIFSELGNGMAIDMPFVSLDFTNISGWNNCPTVGLNVINTIITPSVTNTTDINGNSIVTFPTTSKEQLARNRKGYIVTETVLRAALHSKDSWVSAIWYEYRDISSGAPKIVRYNIYNDYDIGYGFGAETEQTTANFSMNPSQLGILSPAFSIENGDPFASVVSQYSDVLNEAIKEACYQATLRVAQEYYGKKFMCRLPASAICTAIGPEYVNNQKKIPIEYEVVDAAPNIANYTNTTPITFPTSLLHSDSAGFRNPNGLFKCFAYFNVASIASSYNYLRYEQFNPFNSIWSSTSVGEGIISPGTLFYSGVSVEPYRYDPRFAVVTLNDPLNCGIGSYSKLTVVRDPNNVITTWSLTPAFSPITKFDKTGGYLEFISRILTGFSVVADNDAFLNTNGIRKRMNLTAKVIGVSHLLNLQSSAIGHQEYLNLAEYRLSKIDDYSSGFYIPLQWNFIKYGPWVDGTNNNRPVNVIEDTRLNPWTYGSYQRMTDAAKIIAERANTATHTTSYATVTVEGYPEFDLGHEIKSGADNMGNISDISLSFGTDGVKTTYKFKTFFGPIGFTKRPELEAISYNSFSASNNRSGVINFGKIFEDMEAQFMKNNYGGYMPQSPNSPGLSTLTGHINSVGQSSETTVKNPNVVKTRAELDTNAYQESANAKLSSLFTPYTTIPAQNAKNRVPTIEGGVIT